MQRAQAGACRAGAHFRIQYAHTRVSMTYTTKVSWVDFYVNADVWHVREAYRASWPYYVERIYSPSGGCVFPQDSQQVRPRLRGSLVADARGPLAPSSDDDQTHRTTEKTRIVPRLLGLGGCGRQAGAPRARSGYARDAFANAMHRKRARRLAPDLQILRLVLGCIVLATCTRYWAPRVPPLPA